MDKHILLVEDEPDIVVTLTDRLVSEGYTVESAVDGEAGLTLATGKAFDLIILDVMLPRRNGLDVCRDLRQAGVQIPILMLTARGQLVDKVVGLRIGADDYVTKPFEPVELVARIEALMRRAPTASLSPQTPESYQFGSVRVNFLRTEVQRGGKGVELTAREFKLIKFFIQHRGETLSRDQLLNDVWGYDSMPSTRTVDVHVAGLRQKLESNPHHPQFILTMHGLGYKFVG